MNNLLANYAKLEPFYKDIDNIDKDIYRFKMLKATVFEKTDRLSDAYNIYKNIINENEEIRKSIPINMRKNFFNGFGKNAYLGLIRVNTLIYQNNPSKENFEKILLSINSIHARQLKELTQNYTNSDFISLSSLQNNLKSTELIYILFDVDNALVLASISKDKEEAKLFVKPKNFDNLLLNFKEQLVQQYQYNFKDMQNISSSLFQQLPKYDNIDTLHILSDGIISILPFDIYLDGNNKMLFENYTIDYLTTLNIINRQPSLKKEKTFLGIADPEYKNINSNSQLSEYFVALPETRDEVQKISLSFKNKKLLFGNEAKESTIKNMNLKNYDFIHFATHGILGGELRDVNEPALVLSYEGKEDGFLSTSEVAKLQLNAEITVLSACNTGSGKYFRGEGLSGIGRAFKIAGSKNLIVSLWPVDSIATQKLMENFYLNILNGDNYTKALHNAKITLQKNSYIDNNTQRGLKLKTKSNVTKKLDGYTNPYFWSAFILITN